MSDHDDAMRPNVPRVFVVVEEPVNPLSYISVWIVTADGFYYVTNHGVNVGLGSNILHHLVGAPHRWLEL